MKIGTWKQTLHDAALGHINGGNEPWPAGEMSQPTTTEGASTSTLTCIYTPCVTGSFPVRFVIMELLTLQQATTALKSRTGTGVWLRWPKGFPNQNDYEGVVECATRESDGIVVWVQRAGGTNASERKHYLVQMSAQGSGLGGGVEALRDYADGLWGVVDLASRPI